MRIILTFCSLAVSLITLAQTPAKLSFKEAVKIGLQNNLALNQEKNNLVATTVAKNSSMLQLAPSVNIQGNAGRNDGNSFNQQEGQVINGVLDFVGANLNVSMPLFNGMSTITSYKQSAFINEAQMNLMKRTNQEVITNVANQFLRCLLDQRLVVIQEKNLETQQQQYDQIREQVLAGSRPEVDLYNQDYQVKNAELLLLRSRNTLKNNKTILAATLQIDPLAPFELEEPAWDVNAADADVLSIEQLKQTALESRSDLESIKAIENANRFGYYSLKGGYLPSVNAFFQYGSRYNYIHPNPAENFFPDNRSFDNQFFNDNTQMTYGVSFSIPIFGGFQTRSNVVRSKVNYENAKLTTASTEIQVKTSVMLAYQNYRDARSNYEATNAQLKAAELSYNFEKERYGLGISDIVALTQATQNYTRAQADFESARYTLMFQKILINFATGTLRFEDIP
jgi:outer membrane protein